MRTEVGPKAANGSKLPRSTANGPTLDVSNARANCRSGKARLAAKVRDQGRAALGRYPPIGDRLGQCLVSDGFETRIGRADKAKSIQTKKFAIHTLGQRATFGTLRWSHFVGQFGSEVKVSSGV